MADEVKAKRPVPPQFLKKKKVAEEQVVEQLPDPPAEIVVPAEFLQKDEEKKEIDMNGLVSDLMFNRYFQILEKEARPIAENMVKNGAESLWEVKWFLAYSERQQLARELKEKYGLA